MPQADITLVLSIPKDIVPRVFVKRPGWGKMDSTRLDSQIIYATLSDSLYVKARRHEAGPVTKATIQTRFTYPGPFV